MKTFNATPRYILDGVDDQSRSTPLAPVEQISTFAPIMLGFTEKGTSEIGYYNGTTAMVEFGGEAFKLNSKFTNHATPFNIAAAQSGGGFFFKRLFPADVLPQATLLLSIDVIEKQIPKYVRGVDGRFVTDAMGDLIPELDTNDQPVSISGYDVAFVVTEAPRVNKDGQVITQAMLNTPGIDPELLVPVANKLDGASVSQGTQVDPSTPGTVSTRYPLLAFAARDIGDIGNLQGLRLWSSTRGTRGYTARMSEALEGFVYGLQLIETEANASRPRIIQTDTQADQAFFTTQSTKVVNNFDYGIDALMDNWKGQSGLTEMYFYKENFETVAGLLIEKEKQFDPSLDEAETHKFNLFGLTNEAGVPYEYIRLSSVGTGTVSLKENAAMYAAGGSDGTITKESFEAAVKDFYDTFGDTEERLRNIFKYPFTTFVDVGYGVPVKESIYIAAAQRKDTVVLSTELSVIEGVLPMAEAASKFIGISNFVRNLSESDVFGTPYYRVGMTWRHGFLDSKVYKDPVPLNLPLFSKLMAYMGAGTGLWDKDARPNEGIRRVITELVNVPDGDIDDVNFEGVVGAGAIIAKQFDRSQVFFPIFQTIYSDSSSVLNTLLNAYVFADINKQCAYTWRDVVGNDRLTAEEYREEHEKALERRLEGRYDDRVRLGIRAYYTAADLASGQSITTQVDVYGNTNKPVSSFHIVAHRNEETGV